jgi:type I restriction enzyme S subunit
MILIPNSEVLNAFSEFATQIFGKKLLNNKQSTTLSAMRDSLLPKLMSGKIRVPIEKQEAS